MIKEKIKLHIWKKRKNIHFIHIHNGTIYIMNVYNLNKTTIAFYAIYWKEVILVHSYVPYMWLIRKKKIINVKMKETHTVTLHKYMTIQESTKVVILEVFFFGSCCFVCVILYMLCLQCYIYYIYNIFIIIYK